MFGGRRNEFKNAPGVSDARRDLVRALQGYQPEDSSAEYELTDYDARAELVSSVRNVDDFVKAHGLDPSDIWGIDKKLTGENMLKQALGFRPGALEPGHQEFMAFAKQLQEQVVLPYGQTNLTGEVLVGALDRVRDPRSAEALLRGSRTGSAMEGHAAAIQSLFKLGSSLDIGIYDFNSPVLLAGLEGRGDLSDVRMTTDQSQMRQGRGQSGTVNRALGWLAGNRGLRLNETVGMNPFSEDLASQHSDFWNYHTHDHYKMVVAGADFVRAGGAIDDSQRALQGLWLGSANFTAGAMGGVINRHGQATIRRLGTAIERGFFMNHQSVAAGELGQDLFDSLMRQATTAADWIHSREYNGPAHLDFLDGPNGREAGYSPTGAIGSGGIQTRLLTNRGFSVVAEQLFSRMAGEGGTAHVFANRFGKDDAVGIRKMLRGALSHQDTKIQILMDHTQGLPAMDEVRAAGGVEAWLKNGTKEERAARSHLKESLRMHEFLDGLDADLRERVTLIHSRGLRVHAKGAVFRFGSKGNYEFVDLANGSTNWADSSIVDDQWGPRAPHRNMNIITSSEDYKPTERGYYEVESVFGMMAISTSTRAGTSGFDIDKAMARSLFGKYGLNPSQARVVGVDVGSVAKFTVGGSFHVGGGILDLGNLKTLTATQVTDDSVSRGFGFKGQIFVPELTKFIGSARGIAFDVDGDSYKDKNNLPVGSFAALEILAAGVANSNQEIKRMLEALVAERGLAGVQTMLQDPVVRGQLRMAATINVRQTFGNFQGPEPGRAAYDAKAFSQLGFRVDSSGRVDFGNTKLLDSRAMDAALSSSKKVFGLGQREFFFMAGGLSSHGSDGSIKAARFFDSSALNELPVAYMHERDNQTSDYFFLMPFSKLSQLPQRLQNIMSARNLDPVSADIAKALGVSSGGQELVGTSRFAGVNGDPMRGIRFKGYAVAGLAGDNAYMIGERFENAYFADTSWRKTAKISQSSQVLGDAGHIFVSEVRKMAADAHMSGVTALGDDRFLINAAQLDAMQHKLGVSRHYIDNSQLMMLQELVFGTDKVSGTSLMLDLKVGRGLSLVNEGGTSSFTVTGASVRPLTSGDRSILGGKFPMVFVEEQSSAIQAINDTVKAMNPAMHGSLGFGEYNSVFGMGTIKTGQAFIETGIETIATTNVNEQLLKLKNSGKLAQVGEFSNLVRRLGGFIDDSTLQGEFKALAKQLDNIRQGSGDAESLFRDLQARFDATKEHLDTGAEVRMGRKGGGHVATAALAFAVHAMYYTNEFESLGTRGDATQQAHEQLIKERFYGAFAADATRGVAFNRLGIADMPVQALLGVVPLSFIGAASSTAVAMSSQNRVNLLNYHAGGYTDAFFDMMALSPAVKNRSKAYEELVYGGLLGRGGVNDVVFGWEFDPMAGFMPGMEVEVDGKELNPYGERIRALNRIRDVWGGKSGGAKGLARIYDDIGKHQRINAAFDAKLNTPGGQAHVEYESKGGVTSSTIQAALNVAEAAGQRSRTLLIPKIGKRQGKVFGFDANARENISFVFEEVQMLSSSALLSLGSFGDYSHDIQRLQISIQQKMHVLGFLGMEGVLGGSDPERALRNNMGIFEQETYTQLLHEVGELKTAVRQAAVTDLQKQLGGQLALPGHNMVIGTLHEVSEGTMVLGAEAWGEVKQNMVAELARGMGDVTSIAAFEKLVMSAASDAASPDALSKAQAVLAQLKSKAGMVEGNLVANEIASRNQNIQNLRQGLSSAKDTEARSIGKQLELVRSFAADNHARERQLSLQALHPEDAAGRVRVNAEFTQRGYDLAAEMIAARDEMIAERHSELDAQLQREVVSIQSELQKLNAELAALKGDTRRELTNLVNEALGQLVEHHDLRDVLGRGGFQRAGAPMGPLALMSMRIRTAAEFNASNPSLRIFEKLSGRAVFLNIGAMAFNLGDYDGDTGSIFLLHEYSRLKASEAAGEAMSPDEMAKFNAAKSQLRWSQSELVFEHARHYSGMSSLFSSDVLYKGNTKHDFLRGMQLSEARTFLHDLEDSVAKTGRERGINVDAAFNDNAMAERLFAGTNHLGYDEATARDLWQEFRGRKGLANNLGVAVNAYVDEQFKVQRGIENYIESNMRTGLFAATPEQQRASLFKQYFRTDAGKDALSALKKFTGVISDQEKVGDHAMSWNQWITHFTMTSFASTALISKVFEASYVLDSYAASVRSGYRSNLVDAANALGGSRTGSAALAEARLREAAAAGNVEAASLLADFEGRNEYHSRVAGLGLMLQQMSREAIKPKNTDMNAVIRGRIGGSEDWHKVASAVDIAMDQTRVKGLNLFHALVTGKNIDGSKYDLDLLRLAPGGATNTYDHVHSEIKASIVNYFEGQYESLWSAGAADPERLRSMFGDNLPAGLTNTSDITEQKANVRAFAESQAHSQANLLMDNAIAVQGMAKIRQSYLGALASDDVFKFTRVASQMSSQTKLHMIATTASRGKFAEADGMGRALEDIFSSYAPDAEGIQQLREDAGRSQGSNEFADRMANIFEAYIKGGDIQTSVRRGLHRSHLGYKENEAGYADIMRNHMTKLAFSDSEKEAMKTASAYELEDMARAKEIAAAQEAGTLSDDAKFIAAREKVAAAKYYDVISRDQHKPGQTKVPGALGNAADRASLAESIARSPGAAGMSSNYIIPAIAALTLGGSLTFLPGAAHAATGDTAGAVGEVAGMGYAFSNPSAMIQEIIKSGATHREGLVHASIATGAMAAGVAASHLAYEHVARAVSSAATTEAAALKLTARAGVQGMIAAGVAGLAVGGAVGVIATGIAQKLGLISQVNPIPQIMASLTNPEADETAGSEGDVDELLDFEDGENSEGIVEIRNEDGEVVHQDFYRFTWAARSSEADLEGFIEAGLDDFVSHADYETAGLGNSEVIGNAAE